MHKTQAMSDNSLKKYSIVLPFLIVSLFLNMDISNASSYQTQMSTIDTTKTEDVDSSNQKTQNEWNLLPEVDFSTINPDSISDRLIYRLEHLGPIHDIDYDIGHFHRLANAVRMTEPEKGFIDISVWRNPNDNRPYNARVMENITSLAWFYTQEEAWNPYYADSDLKKILEAALTFWIVMDVLVNMEKADGGSQQQHLAPNLWEKLLKC